jgi:hypothetical protein
MRDASLLHYFSDRIRRVYPGFVLAAVFSFLIVLPLADGRITPLHLGQRKTFCTALCGWARRRIPVPSSPIPFPAK